MFFFIILKGRSFIEIAGVVLLQFSSEHFDVGDGYGAGGLKPGTRLAILAGGFYRI